MSEEIKDTKHLQLKSVKEFMKAFGYVFCSSGYYLWNSRFSIPTDKQIISFRTAVMLHNNGNYDEHGNVYERFGFNLYQWEKAKACKIVEKVSLVMNKKIKYIHCSYHDVVFVHPFYEQLFLPNTNNQ